MKKAQMQMGETIAVLFVFFFLAIIALVFYTNIFTAKAEMAADQTIRSEALVVLKRTLAMPELSCTTSNDVQQGCIDTLKLKAMSESGSQSISYRNRDYFFDKFGFTKIEMKQIYPPSPASYIVYDMQKATIISNRTAAIPTVFYDPVTKTEGFGMVFIEVYT